MCDTSAAGYRALLWPCSQKTVSHVPNYYFLVQCSWSKPTNDACCLSCSVCRKHLARNFALNSQTLQEKNFFWYVGQNTGGASPRSRPALGVAYGFGRRSSPRGISNGLKLLRTSIKFLTDWLVTLVNKGLIKQACNVQWNDKNFLMLWKPICENCLILMIWRLFINKKIFNIWLD